MRLLPTLFILAIVVGAWHHFSTRPIPHVSGVVAPDEPVQVNLAGSSPFTARGYQIAPLARFSLEARTLGIERYRVGREAELSPVDLALGWRRMSDSAVLDKLRISQGNRFYFYAWTDAPPIPVREIVEHSANMHLIPADDQVRTRLAEVRVGNIVHLNGYLVRVRAPDGWSWSSSMSRRDSGSGACELVWVEEITVR